MTRKEILTKMSTMPAIMADSDVAAFVDHELEALAVKEQKTKDRAAAKAKDVRELASKCLDVLSNYEGQYIPIETIVSEINEPGVTNGRVASRLGVLVKNGKVAKAEKTFAFEDGTKRRVSGYKIV